MQSARQRADVEKELEGSSRNTKRARKLKEADADAPSAEKIDAKAKAALRKDAVGNKNTAFGKQLGDLEKRAAQLGVEGAPFPSPTPTIAWVPILTGARGLGSGGQTLGITGARYRVRGRGACRRGCGKLLFFVSYVHPAQASPGPAS